MNSVNPDLCRHCGAQRPPGHVACAACGSGARAGGFALALAQAAAGLLGILMMTAGGCCTLLGLMAVPAGVVLWFFTVPVLLIGVSLMRWAVGIDQSQAGGMYETFGPESRRER